MSLSEYYNWHLWTWRWPTAHSNLYTCNLSALLCESSQIIHISSTSWSLLPLPILISLFEVLPFQMLHMPPYQLYVCIMFLNVSVHHDDICVIDRALCCKYSLRITFQSNYMCALCSKPRGDIMFQYACAFQNSRYKLVVAPFEICDEALSSHAMVI